MRRLLNSFHRPRAVHFLGPAWISKVLIVVENNMPKANWFTPDPYSTKAGISAFKWSNHRRDSGASNFLIRLQYTLSTFKSYETSFMGFIPFAKKHMYFLLYWLNKHVFPNKSKAIKVEWIPLVEVLHSFDDDLLYEMTKEDTSVFYKEKFISCIQQRDLVWGVRSDYYECGLEVYHLNFYSRQLGFGQAKWTKKYGEDIKESHNQLDVGLDEKTVDELVLQDVAVEVTRLGAGEGEDISELFGDSEAEVKPEVETRAPRQARATMVETSEPQATKKLAFVSRDEPLGAEMHQNDQKLLFTIIKELTDTRKEGISQPEASSSLAQAVHSSLSRAKLSKFDLRTRDLLHFVEDNSNLSSTAQKTNQPPPISFGEPIVPEIPMVSEITSLRASQAASGESSGVIPPPSARSSRGLGIPIPRPKKKSKVATTLSTPKLFSPIRTKIAYTIAPSVRVEGVPPSLTSISATASLLKLVKEFKQIRTKLRSPRQPSEPQLLQNKRQVFRERMRRDFTTSFYLKAL
ncbi:TMV resistance protein N-like [Pyrus ussuriensis x Pyrus communis]|uniref:TMV resistance protein N-like n=1 Tax=Pyrus ussuriensis x Pyrus communis TaxID=2448454 RepID=A0A5N5I0M4_9ROSA|nr:TMV resistance protein N-like [Pyrus ussuriensis x Pyrus communis]